MKRQAREEREEQNTLLRAYGYHWKRMEDLTDEQHRAIPLDRDLTEIPRWVLLSPLEMPVDKTSILRWIGKRGNTSEDVLGFISDHGFHALGKDEHQVWRIQTPSGNTINLKQALQELERIRIDREKAAVALQEQKRREAFERSVKSLKETLDLHGEAMNNESAWGYSPYPTAKRLPDGTIEVLTYHMEGEWKTTIFEDEAEVINNLYSDGDGYWDPGEWEKP